MHARYAFAVTFRLHPAAGVAVAPSTFDARLYRTADPPGDDGWLFFMNYLWRGALTDPDHFLHLAADALGVDVVDADSRAFETDDDYWDAFTDAIGDDLAAFRADSVAEVVNKYLGSSVERGWGGSGE